MMSSVIIKKPDWLYVAKPEGGISYGYNQEWYRDEWQRLAGCGPTTATQVMTYIGYRDGLLDTADSADFNSAVRRMETIWPYVKPHKGGGLYKTRWFEAGLERFLADKSLDYDVHMLRIYPFSFNRPKIARAAEFIRTGISSDCPVGFLNRHRGKEQELSTWHWVPIVGIREDGGDVRCLVFDEEIERWFSLTQWLRDTTLGGGFVYVTKKTKGHTSTDGAY